MNILHLEKNTYDEQSKRIIESLGKSLKIDIEFDNKERIAISIFWPLAFTIFIITLIVEIIRHRR